MRENLIVLVLLTFYVFILPLANQVQAATYAFVSIVDTNTDAPLGKFQSFSDAAVSGERAAFLGFFADRGAVLSGSRTELTTIALHGPSSTINDVPTISGDSVAFTEAGGSVKMGDGNSLRIVATASFGAFDYDRFLRPAISNGGVAFVKDIVQSNQVAVRGVFLERAGSATTIDTTAFPKDIPYVSEMSIGVAIHDGAVAFSEISESGEVSIITSAAGHQTKIAKMGDPAPTGSFAEIDAPSLSGAVAFRGFFEDGQGIFTGNGGPLTTIVKTGDVAPIGTFSSFSSPSIAGQTAAFLAYYSGGTGIFTGDGGPLQPVIETGQSLFDSYVTALSFDRFGLDPDNGKTLAFKYVLENGRVGIAIATQVPEPSAAIAVVLAVMGLVSVVSRRRNNRLVDSQSIDWTNAIVAHGKFASNRSYSA